MRKILTSDEGTFGPFDSVEETKDSFIAGKVEYPKSGLTNLRMGNYVPMALPLTQRQILETAQAHMDGTAQAFGYLSIADAMSFANSAEQSYSVEGNAFVAWRDAVTKAALKAVDEGKVTSVEELTKSFPGLVFPGDHKRVRNFQQ